MPFVAGEQLGPYRILEQLGQGGMATVFKAYHAALDRTVAIKALHPAFLQEPNFLARFQREAKVVARLEHSNIVPIYDYSVYEGRPYLVMRFIDGETLKARLSRGPLSQAEISLIIDSVGAALSHAHGQGILHRDIKPSNVLLSTDRRIYLADFGLARIAAAGGSTLSSDVMLGSSHYISPEQAIGAKELDEGTDIYSFGVMLYELFVGRVPYNADTPFSIIHDHIYAPLPLPSSINPAVSPQIEQALLRALTKERSDRYPDVASMVGAFREALAHPVQPASAPKVESDTAPVVAAVSAGVSDSRAQISENIAAAPALPSKINRRWLITGLGFILVCVCLLAGWSVSSRLLNAIAPRTTPVAAVILLSTVVFTEKALPQSSPDTTYLQAIADLQEKIKLYIDDPYLHLELALTYLDAGFGLESKVEMELAIQKAGQDPVFFKRAAEQLSKRGLWLESARSFIQLVNLSDEPITKESLEQFSQALYLAAEDPRLIEYTAELRLERIRPPIVDVVRARNFLYRGDIPQAESIVTDLRKRPLQIPETDLLQAEIHLAKGDAEAALPILDELSKNARIPEWIRSIAGVLLAEVTKTPIP